MPRGCQKDIRRYNETRSCPDIQALQPVRAQHANSCKRLGLIFEGGVYGKIALEFPRRLFAEGWTAPDIGENRNGAVVAIGGGGLNTSQILMTAGLACQAIGVLILPGAFLSEQWLQRNLVARMLNAAQWAMDGVTRINQSAGTRALAEALTWVALLTVATFPVRGLFVIIQRMTWAEAALPSFLFVLILIVPYVLAVITALSKGTVVQRLASAFGMPGVLLFRLVICTIQRSLWAFPWLLRLYVGSRVRTGSIGGILVFIGLLLQLSGVVAM